MLCISNMNGNPYDNDLSDDVQDALQAFADVNDTINEIMELTMRLPANFNRDGLKAFSLLCIAESITEALYDTANKTLQHERDILEDAGVDVPGFFWSRYAEFEALDRQQRPDAYAWRESKLQAANAAIVGRV